MFWKSSKDTVNGKTLFTSSVSAVAISLLLVGCSGGGTTDEQAASADIQGECGTVPTVEPNDPNGLLTDESPELQEIFNGFPEEISSSHWADAEALNNGDPVTIGYLQLDSGSTYANAFAEQINVSFDEAKSAGEASELIVKNPGGTGGEVTAADQLRSYNELIQEGADIIIAQPVSGDSFVEAVESAGEQGIPTVTWTGFIPSEYAVDVAPNVFNAVAAPVSEGLEMIDGEGSAVIVQGIEGMSINTVSVEAAEEVIALCPDVEIVGKPTGDFSEAAARSALTTFLATHPQEIDLVYQVASMGSGVYGAFDSAGRESMPVVVDHLASAASLAWWQELQDEGYEGVATGGNGEMGAQAVFEVTMRMANGEGPKFNHVVTNDILINNDNISEFAVPDASTTSSDEIQSAGELLPKEQTDEQFNSPTE